MSAVEADCTKRRFFTKKKLLAGLAVIALVVIGTAAAAWVFTTGGDGGAKGATASATNLTITQGTGPTACSPGGQCDLYLAVNNSNSTPVTLTAVAKNGAHTTTGSCTASNIVVSDKSGLIINVPTGASTVAIPNMVSMVASAPVACAGTTISVPVLATWQIGT